MTIPVFLTGEGFPSRGAALFGKARGGGVHRIGVLKMVAREPVREQQHGGESKPITMPDSRYASDQQRGFESTTEVQPHARVWINRSRHRVAHFHSAVELYYVTQGTLTVWLEGVCHEAHAGQLVLCSSYMTHQYEGSEGYASLSCLIPLGNVPQLRDTLRQSVFTVPVTDIDEGDDRIRLMKLMAEIRDGSADYIDTLAAALLIRLTETVGLKPRPNEVRPEMIKEFLLYIQENLGNQLTLQKVAARFGYSASRFAHLFKAGVSMSFTEYMKWARVTNAVSMLQEGNHTLAEVAAACGFNSLSTFHRVFREVTGTTPRMSSPDTDPGRQA